jgi:hypothetical protein
MYGCQAGTKCPVLHANRQTNRTDRNLMCSVMATRHQEPAAGRCQQTMTGAQRCHVLLISRCCQVRCGDMRQQLANQMLCRCLVLLPACVVVPMKGSVYMHVVGSLVRMKRRRSTHSQQANPRP